MQIAKLSSAGELGASKLEEIRYTAERRLRELEPLLEEAERLRDVLAVIAEQTVPERPLRPAVARTRGDGAVAQAPSHVQVSRARPAQRAAKGANKRLILELIGQRPGITAAEIARSTGLKRTVVASTVSRLKRYGELCDHEHGGVCLPAVMVGAEQFRRDGGGVVEEPISPLAKSA